MLRAVRTLKCFFFCLFLLRLSSAGSLESQSRTAYKSLISTGGGQQWVWGAHEVCQRVWTRTSEPTTISHKSLQLSCVWFKACPPGKFDTDPISAFIPAAGPEYQRIYRFSRTHLWALPGTPAAAARRSKHTSLQILSTHLSSSLSSADAHKSQLQASHLFYVTRAGSSLSLRSTSHKTQEHQTLSRDSFEG